VTLIVTEFAGGGPLVSANNSRFLEDIQAVGKTHERFLRLFHDYLGFLEDIHATSKTLKGFVDLLGFADGSAGKFHEQTHLLRWIEDPRQHPSDLLLRGRDAIGVEDRAGRDVVTGAVAVRAHHGLGECERE
jgi:hypothetical protein